MTTNAVTLAIRQDKKNTTGHTGRRGSPMSGLSAQFWHSAFVWVTITAAVCGGIGIGAAFLSAIIGYQITEESLREADEKISEANERIAAAELETALANARTAKALMAVVETGRANALTTFATKSVTEAMAVAAGLTTRDKTSEATRVLYISAKVEPFAGKQFDAILTSSSIELETLLGSLAGILKKSGWIEVARKDDDAIQLSSAGGPGLISIRVDASRHPELLAAAESLASALNAEGVAATLDPKSEADTINPNVIHIVVGPKP